MLDVNLTAAAGATLSVPGLVTNDGYSYLAIPVEGQMKELPQFAPPAIHRLMGWLDERGKTPLLFFFRYLDFGRDGSVRLQVCATVEDEIPCGGEVIAGTVPAGDYVKATLTGPYDRLYDGFSMLDGWMRSRSLEAERLADGSLAAQLENYRIGPAQESDPMKWQTDILIKAG